MGAVTAGLVIGNLELREEVRAGLAGSPVRIVMEDTQRLDSAQLRRLSPDLLFIESQPASDALPELIRKTKLHSPSTLIAVVSDSADSELILSAMRAGADEFVYQPINERLPATLERLSAQVAARHSTGRAAGKVIGVLSAKGGCGATTVACHLASELQRLTPEDIQLADLDLETGLVGFLMKAKTSYSTLDAVKNLHRLDMSLWKGMVAADRPRLDVISAPGVALNGDFRPEQFRDVFHLLRANYGWVVADLGRNLNPVSMALLELLDELLLVSTLRVPALYQGKAIIRKLLDVGFPSAKIRFVLNRLPPRSEITADELRKSMGVPVYAELFERPELEEAYMEGRLVAPTTTLGKQFAALACKLAGVRPEPPRRGFLMLPFRKTAPEYQGT